MARRDRPEYDYPYSRAFGSLAAALRSKNRWTAAETGRHLGIDRASVNRMERGEAAVTLERAAAVAELYDVPLERMLSLAATRGRQQERVARAARSAREDPVGRGEGSAAEAVGLGAARRIEPPEGAR